VVVNKPLKNQLCHLYGEWLLSGNCPLTPAGSIRSSEALLGQWIKTAWDDISPESIVKGFKKCCVSNYMNGTEKMMSCGRKTMKKTLLLVMKVLTMISKLSSVFVTFYYNKNLTLINTINIIYHINILTQMII
jgi:hypothetical protein